VAGATLPIGFPTIAVVARVSVPPNECDREHDLRVELFKPDEAQPRMTGDIHFTPRSDASRPDRPVGISCLMTIFGLSFEPGDYEFRLSVAGRPLGRVVLSVIHRPA
jgi:hypothetical protein